MSPKMQTLIVVLATVVAATSPAADRYVATNGTGDGSSWANATNSIHGGVLGATAGCTVWVSNGVYTLTNQLAIANFTIRSYNEGALDRDGTVINGNYPNVTNRCFYVDHSNAVVEGFTITNGYAPTNNGYGGGVYLNAGTLRNCLVTGNQVTNTGRGGGVYAIGAMSLITNCDLIANAGYNLGCGAYVRASAQLWNCRVMFNWITYTTNTGTTPAGAGAGIYVHSTALPSVCIANSLIVSNRLGGKINGEYGGGIYMTGNGIVRNCLIMANYAWRGGGMAGEASSPLFNLIENCTIVDNSAPLGAGGIFAPYKDNNTNRMNQLNNVICYHNPSSDVGVSYAFNNFYSNCCVSVAGLPGSGNTTTAPSLVSRATGDYRLWPWSVGVDAGLWQAWMTNATDLAGQPRLSANGLPDMGAYETTAGPPVDQYVAHGGQTPAYPYTNWLSAASNIQDAANAAFGGNIILVSNGVYVLTNQVVMGNFTLKSFKSGALDRDGTIVNGGYPSNTNRCFALNGIGSTVDGFTITNGFTLPNDPHGGGIYLTNGVLRNCLVTGCTVTNGSGGGVYASGASGLVTNCDLIGNRLFGIGVNGGGGLKLASGAQAWGCKIMYNYSTGNIFSVEGGGVHMAGGSYLVNSDITSNTASGGETGYGVAIVGSGNAIRNCRIMGNDYSGSVSYPGAVGFYNGSSGASIENCTIVSNRGYGIRTTNLGCLQCQLANTVSFFNTDGAWATGGGGAFTATNCCFTSTNTLVGSGNITNNPQFANAAAGDYRLTPRSPCLNTGTYLAWMEGATDLDGFPRISPKTGGTVDMGAYEFPIQGGSVFSLR